MQFKANIRSYILLGFMFMIFVGIPAAILVMLISTPVTILGALAGNFTVLIISVGVIFIVGAGVTGWLVFRFVKSNRFG